MNMAVIPEFVVTIPVKPYVKRFIELNFGLPADFSKYPEIQEKVNRCLKKPRTQYDNKYKTFKLSTYSENIEIVISKHYFDRYGCEFSLTDSIKFGQYFEYQAKDLMRNLIGMSLAFGKTQKKSIMEIRKILGFDESQWKYESIKKDFMKHRSEYDEINFQEDIFNEFLKLVSEKTLETLYKKRTM